MTMLRLTTTTQLQVLLKTLVGALSSLSSGRRFVVFVSATIVDVTTLTMTEFVMARPSRLLLLVLQVCVVMTVRLPLTLTLNLIRSLQTVL